MSSSIKQLLVLAATLSGFHTQQLVLAVEPANTKIDDGQEAGYVPDNSMVESEFPNSMVQELTASGLGKFSQADFLGASKDFSKAVKFAPKNGSLYLQLGLSQLELGEHKSAIESFDKAVSLSKTNREIILACKGKAYLGLNQYNEALNAFSAAIAADPKFPLAYIGKADTHLCLGEDDKALADLETAIRLDPEQPEAYFLRSRYYKKKDQHELALKDFDKAVILDKAYLERSQETTREWQKNKHALSGLLKLGKNTPEASDLIGHGLALFRAGNHLEAIHALTEAICNEPDSLEAFKWRASVYMHMSSFAYAIEDLDRAISITPADPELFASRAKAYLELGKANLALADYSKAIELSQKPQAEFFEDRGLVYSRLGQSAKAIADFSKALEFAKEDPGIYLNRGLEYMAEREFTKAIEDFSQAINFNPQLATARKFRAQARLANGDKAGALNDLQKALLIYSAQKDLFGSKQTAKMIAEIKNDN
ncbi:MAG: tetratricopeptide repeat protein [Candidatus Obscuribacterales bacterium]|nr:tetratricopeptide repeat protein [Candidatus Obscuribacterales bacterium]